MLLVAASIRYMVRARDELLGESVELNLSYRSVYPRYRYPKMQLIKKLEEIIIQGKLYII